MSRRSRLVGCGVGVAVAVMSGAASSSPDHRAEMGSTSGRCLTCHATERVLSHPVDVLPSMSVPGHLPLSSGRITCTTCHDLTSDRPRLRGDGALCGECHRPSAGRPGDIHALATPRAHLGSREDGGWSAADWSFGPDPESGRCMSCHDGALARRGDVRIGRATGFTAARFLGGQHPIGVEQRPRGVGDNLMHPDRIDPAIRLFDGRLGCGSCHSPYADNEMLLVIENDRSRLCLACHDF